MERSDKHFELDPKLLDNIIVSLKHAKGRGERRRNPRQRFPLKQPVAPFYRKMPRREQFKRVTCFDLSASGISFFWDAVPDFAKVIVGLGAEPELTYVGARVVRHVKCGSTGRVLVGCEFLDRVAIS